MKRGPLNVEIEYAKRRAPREVPPRGVNYKRSRYIPRSERSRQEELDQRAAKMRARNAVNVNRRSGTIARYQREAAVKAAIVSLEGALALGEGLAMEYVADALYVLQSVVKPRRSE